LKARRPILGAALGDQVTPDEVRAVEFRRPRIGKRGYDKEFVDDILSRIEQTLRSQPRISREELNAVKWRRPPIGKRGYREEDVEELVQRVLTECPVF
jgi:DivIVA domain-containing protein